MKDKNVRRHTAAHDPEMRFGGTSDGTGTVAAVHVNNIMYRVIR